MTIDTVPAGLRGVAVSDTAIGDVRGDEGYYHYRGRSAVELARTRTFDDAAALVLDGELPDAAGLARFRAELAERRELPAAVHAILPTLASAGTDFAPLAGLRAALATLGAADGLAPVWGATPRSRRADALRVVAATPTILAALHRLRRGLEPVAPREDLHGAAAWLHLLTGAEPDPAAAAAVEHYLVATIDHGFNASTFTARVAASAGTDVAAAVVAAIGTFAGPLHGGAPDRALEAVDEIGAPERVDDYVRAKLASGDRIMGFGHAVYRTADPRAVLLREVARGLRDRPGGEVVALAETVQERTEALLAEHRPGRDLRANVEFWARRRDAPGRHPARDVHADVRGQPGRRLVRARAGTGGGVDDHPSRGAVRGADPLLSAGRRRSEHDRRACDGTAGPRPLSSHRRRSCTSSRPWSSPLARSAPHSARSRAGNWPESTKPCTSSTEWTPSLSATSRRRRVCPDRSPRGWWPTSSPTSRRPPRSSSGGDTGSCRPTTSATPDLDRDRRRARRSSRPRPDRSASGSLRRIVYG